MSLTSQRICKFFIERGSCKKGDQCDFSHNLDLAKGQGQGQSQGQGQGQGYGQDRNQKRGPNTEGRWDRKPNNDFQDNKPNNDYQDNRQPRNNYQNRRLNEDYQPAPKRNYNHPNSNNYNNQSQVPQQPNNQSQIFQQPTYPPLNDYPKTNDKYQQNRPYQQRPQFNDLVQLTNFKINDFIKFIPVFQVNNTSMVGFLCEKEIILYQIDMKIPSLVDMLMPQKLSLPNMFAKNAWLQKYQDDVILMVAYKSTQSSQTISLALYVSFIKNQDNVIQIIDVCNGNISGCYMDTENQHLYVFSFDKQIRVFVYNQQLQKMVIGKNFNVPDVIECFTHIPGTTNVFLFGGQNGLLGTLIAGNLNILKIDLQGRHVMEIKSDPQNQRYFLLTWAADSINFFEIEDSSDVLLLHGNYSLGNETVYHFKRQLSKIQYSQNAMNQNILLVANIYGTLVTLQEKTIVQQQQQWSQESMGDEVNQTQPYFFQQYNQYPPYIKDAPKLNLISDILVYDHKNENNASFKYLFIGRINESNSAISNVEIFSLTTP